MSTSSKNIIIVYDTFSRSAEKTARIIEQAIGYMGQIKVYSSDEIFFDDVKDLDMLIVGSPTHRGRPSISVAYFIDDIANHSLKDVQVAAFAVRPGRAKNGGFVTNLQKRLSTLAAKHLAISLRLKGGTAAMPPLGLSVEPEHETITATDEAAITHWAHHIEDVFVPKSSRQHRGHYVAPA